MTGNPSQHPTVVIGGGIIGLSIAVTLQKRGERVLLLDAKNIGAGASWGNAGHLATEQVFPIANPSILARLPSMLLNPLGPLRIDWRYLPQLTPWMLRLLSNMRPAQSLAIHQALLQLNQHCLSAWAQFAQDWDLTRWVRLQGALIVAEKVASLRQLQAHGEKLNSLGIVNDYLNQEQVLRHQPHLSTHILGGLFYPETGHVVDLPAVMQQLLKSFVAMGGQVHEHCAVHSAQQGNGTVQLQTCVGTIIGKRVVLAAGAQAKALAFELTGVKVPLDTERGYHLMLPHESHRLSIPVSSADRHFIMTPMNDGLRLAGTVEYAGLKAPPNMQRAEQLLKLANPLFAQPLDERQAKPWMGFRPSIADSLPVIDRCGSVFLAFGHHHLGLTQAAMTAQLISGLYFDEASPIDLSPYRLHRF